MIGEDHENPACLAIIAKEVLPLAQARLIPVLSETRYIFDGSGAPVSLRPYMPHEIEGYRKHLASLPSIGGIEALPLESPVPWTVFASYRLQEDILEKNLHNKNPKLLLLKLLRHLVSQTIFQEAASLAIENKEVADIVALIRNELVAANLTGIFAPDDLEKVTSLSQRLTASGLTGDRLAALVQALHENSVRLINERGILDTDHRRPLAIPALKTAEDLKSVGTTHVESAQQPGFFDANREGLFGEVFWNVRDRDFARTVSELRCRTDGEFVIAVMGAGHVEGVARRLRNSGFSDVKTYELYRFGTPVENTPGARGLKEWLGRLQSR